MQVSPVLRRTNGGLKRSLALLAASVAGIAVGLATAVSAIGTVVAAIAAASALLAILNPELLLLGILLTRPMLDLAPGGYIGIAGQPLDLAAAAGLLLVLSTAVFILANHVQVARIPLFVPFTFLICVAGLSTLGSGDLATSTSSLIRLFVQLSIYVLAFCVVRRAENVDRMAMVIVAAALAPVMWGFGEILTGQGQYLFAGESAGIRHPRLAGPSGGGLTIGTMVSIASLVTLVLLMESRQRAPRAAYLVLLLFFGVALYFSLARMVWLGVVIALMVLGVLRYRVLLFAVPIMIAASLLLVPGIANRWAPVLENTESTTAAGRLDLWEGAWSVFEDHPVLGAGIGVGDLEAGRRAVGETVPTHSDYFRALADMGVLGLVALLWLLAATGAAAMRAVRSLKTPRYKGLALAFFAAWVAFLVIRVSGNVLTHQVFQYYFWAFAGLALALPGVEYRERREKGASS